jgi:hypothetical protein
VEERAVRTGLGRVSVGETPFAGLSDQAHNFGDLLLEAIDETLADLLGRRTRDAIYDHLERNHLVARSEVPDQLQALLTLLDETFGRGSKTIGKVIARKLFSKLEWEFSDVPGYELPDYVEAVKVRISREVLNHTKHG